MTGATGQAAERPKIAAMERGPGPARYSLPSLTGWKAHDGTKKLHPCYSFVFRKNIGPGPAHALDPTFTRHGRDGTPHYSLYSRHKELEPFKTPGPSVYEPEKHHHPYSVRTPAYSMGERTRYRKRDANPSPNSYTLPILLGEKIPNRTSSACYSMPGRRDVGGFDTDYAKTPGPARYGVTSAEVMQRKAPNYSIQGRNYMPSNNTKKPGPGAHCPEKATITVRAAPSFSMGVRHSEFICPLIIDVSD